MKRSEFIWEEFIYGGHWLSIGASAVALSTIVLISITEIKWEFLLIVYLGTQCIYNYNHHKEIEIDSLTNPNRVKHLSKYHKYSKIIISIYGTGFFLFLFLFGNLQSIFFGTTILILGLLFSSKAIDLFKRFIGTKLIYTSFSWGLLIPFTAIYHSQPLDFFVLIFFLFAFFRTIITTTFFDIKDIKIDKKRHLLTLPIVFGKDKCLTLLQIFNIISLMPILFGIFVKIIPIYSIFLIVLFFYSFYYIQKARNRKTDIPHLAYIMVDGEFYYWPFLLIIGLILLA